MSESSEPDEDTLKDYFNEIRIDLNLDETTAVDAWERFRRINSKYTLEGNKMEWMCCALYVSCRRGLTPTMKNNRAIEGNMVSLTRILRSCNINLIQFFSKMRNWVEMDNFSPDMNMKLSLLEKKFNVTSVIFRKYKPIFEELFKFPFQSSSRFVAIVKNRKNNRKQALNTLDVFTFCWNLFVFIKSHYSQISDDLVNSYHLLLVCLDYCFSAVLSFDNYKDIVNTQFYDVLSRRFGKDAKAHNNENRVSIIEILCEQFYGNPNEVKQITEYWFKPMLRRRIEKKELKKRESGISIMDSEVVDANYKYIKKEYENFVLTIGDFDECMYLNESAIEELGMNNVPSNQIDEQIQAALRFNRECHANLMPATPLTAMQYLHNRTPVSSHACLTPVTSATQSVSRLQSILINRALAPGKDLQYYFSLAKQDAQDKIAQMIEKMGDIFLKAYSQDCSSAQTITASEEIQFVVDSSNGFAKHRLDTAIQFFYLQLEKIIKHDTRRKPIEENLIILYMDTFLQALFMCSLEIVRFAYCPTTRAFPWILDIFADGAFKVHPFHFYKVIEPLLRVESSITRELVKHLSTIEENILDSLAWTADSPLWTSLNRENGPKFEDVKANGNTFNSPFKCNVSGIALNLLTTPVRRQLFPSNDQQETKVEDKNDCDEQEAVDKVSTSTKTQSKSEIRLFFRKVYALASSRLNDMYNKLGVQNDSKNKIWTCLEHVLTNNTILMCEHHLDQMIMCCMYSICRVNTEGNPISFKLVIQNYRTQPQADSNVYRNVLVTLRDPYSSKHDSSRRRASVIEFYNTTFVTRLGQDFFANFTNHSNALTLSPMPAARPVPVSPSKRRVGENVFVSPLLHTNPLSPARRNSMKIQCSNVSGAISSQCLQEINEMVKYSPRKFTPLATNSLSSSLSITSNGLKRVSKRLLQDDQEDGEGESGASKMFRGTDTMNRKIRGIMADRMNLSLSDAPTSLCEPPTSLCEPSTSSCPAVAEQPIQLLSPSLPSTSLMQAQ